MDVKKTGKEKAGDIFRRYLGNYFVREEGRAAIPDERLRETLVYFAKGASLALLTFIYSHSNVAFSSIPLGYAFMCSLKSFAPWSFAGLLLGAVTDPYGMALPLTLIYTALFLGRILVYRTFGMEKKTFALFSEPLKIRAIEVFASALLIAAYRASVTGFLLYDTLGAAAEIMIAPLSLLLFSYAFDKRNALTEKGELALLGVIFLSVFALDGITVFGFSLSKFAAMIITLFAAGKGGVLRGGVYGIVCGMASGIAYSPAVALIGIAYAIFKRAGNAAAFSVAALFGTVCSFYVGGVSAAREFLPELIGGIVVYSSICATSLPEKIKIFKTADPEEARRDVVAEKREEAAKRRLETLSEAFGELSKTFFTLSDKQSRVNSVDASELCDKVCDEFCPKCALHSVCWKKEYSSTSDVFRKIARGVVENGSASLDDVAGYMKNRCRKMDKLIERINELHGRLLEDLIKQNKAETVALDYEAMGHLLKEATLRHSSEYTVDEAKTKKLTEASRYLGLYAKSVSVYGKRRTSVIVGGIDLGKVRASANEVRSAYEKLLGIELDPPEFEVDGDEVSMSLTRAKRFCAEYASANKEKDGEKFSGDCICMFDTGENYFYSLISDGMGSGSEAALTSRLCGVFLRRMLEAGNSKPVALEMLNNFLRSKNTECFATVDLFEFDLMNGKASFIKGGAASSYVLRGDRIFKITSNTTPFGIVKKVNAEEVKFEIKDGDVIVMVSDGAVQTQADSAKLCEILASYRSRDLQTLADDILTCAKERSGRDDDVSVGVIRASLIRRPELKSEEELEKEA